MVKKNDLVKVEITETNNLGSGVGRTEGQVHFVVGACEGDTVIARESTPLSFCPHSQVLSCIPVSVQVGAFTVTHSP